MKRLHRLLALLLVLSLLLPNVLQLPVSASEISLVAEETIEYLTLEEAGELIRTCMAARENVPAFHVIIEEPRVLSEGQIHEILIQEAIRHTGIPGQGDELRWVYAFVGYDTTEEYDGRFHKVAVSGLDFTYYNTPQQEKILCDRIDQLMIELDIANKSDYEKVKALYEYVCENVSYSDDYLMGNLVPGTEAHNHIYTAYGALINGSAVCQGYSSLIYRLMLEAGIDCRLIAGDEHGWNIVKLDGSYYLMDATWDSDLTDYRWFLNGSASFQKYGHAPWPEYNTEAYLDAHPISPIDYGAPAVAAGSGQCGNNATWSLSGDGVLTISGTGDMWDAGTEDALWSGLNGYVKQVVIEDGITSIGNYVFYNSPQLTEVSIPSSVTHIGSSAFGLCNQLESIVLPDSVQTVGDSAFISCSRLKEITLSAGMKEIPGSMFMNCTALENVTIPNSVTKIGEKAFANCTGLKTMIIPNSVTSIEFQAFASAFSKDYDSVLVIPESVTEVGADCFAWANLREITWNAKAERVEAWTFYFMPYLEKVTINGPVTYIGESAFQYCNNLKEVILPQGVTHMGENVFSCCASLKTIDLPDSLENIPVSAFSQCFALESIIIPSSVKIIERSAFQECIGLKTVVISGNVSEIQEAAFAWCPGLETVTFLGDAPVIFDSETGIPVFHSTQFVAYYPKDNATWTADVRQNYGSNEIRWIDQEHSNVPGDDPAGNDVARVYGNTRYDTAFKAADMLKEQLGVEKFQTIIVANGESFADALSGSYLAAVKDAPILLVKNNKDTMNRVKDYIRANLAAGGTVYLLGGVNAIPQSMETGLEGFYVKRLGGATRYATNLLILEEAGVEGKDILICTGTGFADSLSASAVKLPILLVKESLTADQKSFLANTTGKKYIIGGVNAVSEKIENAVKAYGETERLGGATRYATSVLVAEEFFENPTAVVLAYAQNFPDGLSGGALACGINAPLILTATGKDSAAAAYTKSLHITSGFVLGGPTLISDKAVKNIFAMTAGDSILIK